MADEWLEDRLCPEPWSALIVDGFNSSSVAHLIEHHNRNRLGVPVRAFSYSQTGRPYYWADTWRALGQQAQRLAIDYLPVSRGRAVSPIGASGGGVVALLGVARWASARGLLGWDSDAIRAAIPGLILIAPAISPPAELLEHYEQLYPPGSPISSGIPRVPLPVRELCDEASALGSRMAARLGEAFAMLGQMKVAIEVMIWPPDAVCPYPWRANLQAVAEPVIHVRNMAPEHLRTPRSALERVVRHLQFLRDGEVIEATRERLAVQRRPAEPPAR